MSTPWTPFASARKKSLEIPDSDGKVITIRALGFRELERAQRASMEKAGHLLRTMGGVAAMGGMEGIAAAAAGNRAAGEFLAEKGEPAPAPDPLQTHDAGVLIELGVVAWPDGLKVEGDAIDKLDGGFAEWLAREVYEISRPRTADERKNV
jgi:hypothetical protein